MKNLSEMLSQMVAKKPHDLAYTFITDQNTTVDITYAEVERKAKIIAGLIQDQTVEGARILLVYPPGIELITAFFGCMYSGRLAILCYPPQTLDLAEKFIHIAHNSNPSLCLTTKEILSKVGRLKMAKKILKIPVLNAIIKKSLAVKYEFVAEFSQEDLNEFAWIATDATLPTTEDDWMPLQIEPNHLAFLQYTSGSTGYPKGVMVSHGNLLANLSGLQNLYHLTPDDHCVSWLPPYHDMGLIAGILAPVFVGYPSRLMSPLAFLKNPVGWLELISNYSATCSMAPNFAFELCVKKVTPAEKENINLAKLRLLVSGAEPIRYKTVEKFTDTFKSCGFNPEALNPSYGLAESTLIVSGKKVAEKLTIQTIDRHALQSNQLTWVDPEHPAAQTIISCGVVIPEHQICIVHPDTNTLCGPNEIGEVWLSGPSITQGYWQEKELTAEIFNGFLSELNGYYLRSGDLGFIKDNHLFICGRMKDLIIMRGKKYYPQDIERTIEDTLGTEIRMGCSIAFSVNQDDIEQLILLAEVKGILATEQHSSLSQSIKAVIAKEFGLDLHGLHLLPPKSIKKTTSGKLRRAHTKELFVNNKLNFLYSWAAACEMA